MRPSSTIVSTTSTGSKRVPIRRGVAVSSHAHLQDYFEKDIAIYKIWRQKRTKEGLVALIEEPVDRDARVFFGPQLRLIFVPEGMRYDPANPLYMAVVLRGSTSTPPLFPEIDFYKRMGLAEQRDFRQFLTSVPTALNACRDSIVDVVSVPGGFVYILDIGEDLLEIRHLEIGKNAGQSQRLQRVQSDSVVGAPYDQLVRTAYAQMYQAAADLQASTPNIEMHWPTFQGKPCALEWTLANDLDRFLPLLQSTKRLTHFAGTVGPDTLFGLACAHSQNVTIFDAIIRKHLEFRSPERVTSGLARSAVDHRNAVALLSVLQHHAVLGLNPARLEESLSDWDLQRFPLGGDMIRSHVAKAHAAAILAELSLDQAACCEGGA